MVEIGKVYQIDRSTGVVFMLVESIEGELVSGITLREKEGVKGLYTTWQAGEQISVPRSTTFIDLQE